MTAKQQEWLALVSSLSAANAIARALDGLCAAYDKDQS